MATAIASKLQNFIDGEFVDPADGGIEDVINPSTGDHHINFGSYYETYEPAVSSFPPSITVAG